MPEGGLRHETGSLDVHAPVSLLLTPVPHGGGGMHDRVAGPEPLLPLPGSGDIPFHDRAAPCLHFIGGSR